MGNVNGQKGYRFEKLVERFLGCKRIGGINGANDQGDLYDPDWIIQCKDEQRIDLPGAIGDAEGQLANALRSGGSQRWIIAITKKRKANVSDSYATMPVWQFRQIRDYLRYLEAGGIPDSGLSVFKAQLEHEQEKYPFGVTRL